MTFAEKHQAAIAAAIQFNDDVERIASELEAGAGRAAESAEAIRVNDLRLGSAVAAELRSRDRSRSIFAGTLSAGAGRATESVERNAELDGLTLGAILGVR